MFEIVLNQEAAAVLLRCLGYGSVAVSQSEQQSGVAKVVEDNINLIRNQVFKKMTEAAIKEAANTDN